MNRNSPQTPAGLGGIGDIVVAGDNDYSDIDAIDPISGRIQRRYFPWGRG
jgi:hypothetical protein